MDQIRNDEPEGASACAQNAGAGAPSGGAGPERRNSARRKLAAVTRLLRGEPLETLARELNVTVARLSQWRDRALVGAVSGAVSPVTGRRYGLARVTRVWHLSRATVYRRRTTASAAAPPRPARHGPVGAYSDAELLEHIRAQILGSRLHGEGYRKIWARLRHGGIRTSARRVRRLMGQHGLLAPHRLCRPEQRAHDGTITTTAVDAMWGTDMTETVTVRDGRARVFVAVDHCSSECVGNPAARHGN